GFFQDCRRIAGDRSAAGALLGLAGWQALVLAATGALVIHGRGRPAEVLAWVAGGASLGCAAAILAAHPHRCLGLVPMGSTLLLASLAWALAGAGAGVAPLPCLLLGLAGGLAAPPLRSAFLSIVPADARANAVAALNAATAGLTAGVGGLVLVLGEP